MKIGYLVPASERRIIVTTVDNLSDIYNAIGCGQIEHGTTLATEDQLHINGDEVYGMPEHFFWVEGVPFPFSDNAVLIGVSPIDGDTLEQPTMTIDEFRSLITFTGRDEIRRSSMEWAGSN